MTHLQELSLNLDASSRPRHFVVGYEINMCALETATFGANVEVVDLGPSV